MSPARPLTPKQERALLASVFDERQTYAKKRRQLALRIFPACMAGILIGGLGYVVPNVAFVVCLGAWLWLWSQSDRGHR